MKKTSLNLPLKNIIIENNSENDELKSLDKKFYTSLSTLKTSYYKLYHSTKVI